MSCEVVEREVFGAGDQAQHEGNEGNHTPESSGKEDSSFLSRQEAGLLRAKQRELVRQAARRGVVFGFVVGDGDGEGEGIEKVRRKVEAVQNGRVVESSFAKGEWGVRWR